MITIFNKGTFGAKFFRANGNEHFRKAALGLLTLIAILMLYSVFK
jgi:hypothetical protein